MSCSNIIVKMLLTLCFKHSHKTSKPWIFGHFLSFYDRQTRDLFQSLKSCHAVIRQIYGTLQRYIISVRMKQLVRIFTQCENHLLRLYFGMLHPSVVRNVFFQKWCRSFLDIVSSCMGGQVADIPALSFGVENGPFLDIVISCMGGLGASLIRPGLR